MSNPAKRRELEHVARESLRIIPRPEITIIRSNPCFLVDRWNVPEERISKFFYCYYSYTPDAAEITANGKTHVMGPDRFVIIPADLPHKLRQLTAFKHLFMHFVASAPYNNLHDVISIDAQPYLELLKYTQDKGKNNLALYALLYSLLLAIPQENITAGQVKDQEVERAIQIIRSEPANPPPLESLAAQLNMSVSSLSHRFKNAVGLSPAQYALRFRLEYALIQLAAADAPDMNILAENCGFANRYHFSKQFKKQYGLSPGKMRSYLLKEKSVF